MKLVSTQKGLGSIFLIAVLISSTFAAVKEDLVTEDLPGCGHYNFDSYSGYIPIDDHNKFHYVLVESQSNPETDPFIIWFTGGPGCSGMLAYFMENGPCVWDGLDTDPEPHPNEYSWNAKANVLYVDNPAGVGFNLGYRGEYLNDKIAGEQELNFTLAFFERYPEFLSNELYITGESYGGIYVPYLAYNLHKGNHTTRTGGNLNLQGIAVGNGVTDWKYDGTPAYVEMSFAHGLIPLDLQRRIKESGCSFIEESEEDIPFSRECQSLGNEWASYIQKINVYDVYREPRDGGLMSDNSVETLLKGEEDRVGYTPFLKHFKNQTPFTMPVPQYMDRDDVRRVFHVTEKKDAFQACVRFNYERLPEASIWIYPTLKEAGYRILKYTGDTDGAVPTLGTLAWIDELGWDLQVDHEPFVRNGKVAGYYTKRDGLELVVFHGVGHLVPMWMREESQEVLYKWINGQRP
ncbi:unnamed protein product [Moneuplotes crassus]|uniref:Carboxypeptidase n=1 Tax=Euplotes crassus TaxID=5936 RepID=A0AAD1UJJ6_EUPCR|nr:unnamed protein product [Moneuplotes crassus]